MCNEKAVKEHASAVEALYDYHEKKSRKQGKKKQSKRRQRSANSVVSFATRSCSSSEDTSKSPQSDRSSELSERDVERQFCVLYAEEHLAWPEAVRVMTSAIERMKEETRANPRDKCECQPKMLPVFRFHAMDTGTRYFVGVLSVKERSRRQGTKVAEVHGIRVGTQAGGDQHTERTVIKLYGESARMPAHEHDIVLVEEIRQEEALALVNDQDNFRYEDACYASAGDGAQSEMFEGICLGKVVAILHSHVFCKAGNPVFLAKPSRCQDSLFVNSDQQHLCKLTPFSGGLPVVLAPEPQEQNVHEIDYTSVRVMQYAQTSLNGRHELPMPEAHMDVLPNGDHARALKLFSGYTRWFNGEESLRAERCCAVMPQLAEGSLGATESVYGKRKPLFAIDAKGTAFPEDGVVVVPDGVDVVLSLAGNLLLDDEVRRGVCVRPSSLFSRAEGIASEHMLPELLRHKLRLQRNRSMLVVVVGLRRGGPPRAVVRIRRCRFTRVRSLSFQDAEKERRAGKDGMVKLWEAVQQLRADSINEERDDGGDDQQDGRKKNERGKGDDDGPTPLSGEDLVEWLMEAANEAIQGHILAKAKREGQRLPKMVLRKTLKNVQGSLKKRRDELGKAYDDVMALCKGNRRFGKGKRAELLGLVHALEGLGTPSLGEDGRGKATFSSPLRKAGDMLNQLALLAVEGAVARADFDRVVAEVEASGMLRGMQVIDSTQHELDRLFVFQRTCSQFVRLRGQLVTDAEHHTVAFHAKIDGVSVSPQRLRLSSLCPCVQAMEGDECKAWCTITKAAQSSRLFAVAVQAMTVEHCKCSIKEQCLEHTTFPSAFHGVLRVHMGRLSREQIRKAHNLSTVAQVLKSVAQPPSPDDDPLDLPMGGNDDNHNDGGGHGRKTKEQLKESKRKKRALELRRVAAAGGKGSLTYKDLLVVPNVTIHKLREGKLWCTISGLTSSETRMWRMAELDEEVVCLRVPCRGSTGAEEQGPGYHLHGTLHVDGETAKGLGVVVRLPPERETVALRPVHEVLGTKGRIPNCRMDIFRRRRYCAHTTPTFRNKEDIEPVWNEVSERRKCPLGVNLGKSCPVARALESEQASERPWLQRLDNEKRDALQVCACSRVFALHGPAGTGKSLFVSALVCLALKAGWKVLVVAQQNVAVDNLRTAIREQMREVFGYSEGKAKELAACVKAEDRHDEGNDQREGACDKASVVMCTIGTMLFRKKINSLEYDLVIVDEAGTVNDQQMSHCWAMASQQVVLVGDHRQLPPYTASLDDFVAERVVQDTVFEQVCTEGQDYGIPMKQLTINYRMHPDIMARPSELFYDGKLQGRERPCKSDAVQAVVDELCRRHDARVLLARCDGREKLYGATRSPYNDLEVEEVVHIVGWLLSKRMQAEDILVVTPYERQKCLLQSALRIYSVRADTIDGVQGNEGAVVIISWVRTPLAPNNLLFLTDRRVNVAITRARDLLIHVCNPKHLSNNPRMRKVLKGIRPIE